MATVNPYQQSAIKNLAYPAPSAPAVTGLRAQSDLGIQKTAQAQTKALTEPTNSGSMDNRVAAAALTAQAGQRALAVGSQQVQSSAQVGQTALATQEAANKNALGLRKLSLDSETSKASARLARLGEDRKNTLLDDNLSFKRDQAGRTLFNERQLLDWAATKARTSEDFENAKQVQMQAHSRNLMLMEQASKVLGSELDNMTRRTITMADLETKKQILSAKNAADKAVAKAKAKQAEGAAMGRGIGMVVGGAVGVVAGWGVASVPLGIAGATVGGALGEAAGASLSK